MKKRFLALMVVAVLSIAAGDAWGSFLYTVTDLGTFGGTISYAEGINDSGQVVGEAQTSDYGPYHAFLYSGGSMQDLGTLGGADSWASGAANIGSPCLRSWRNCPCCERKVGQTTSPTR
ncbi:MAG: hypothetical protein ABSG68_07380 [Thermoguttaceae bacterium]|jgi:probable HAF family extracellular repeat protein